VALRNALAKTFKIEAFDECGHVELDLTQRVAKFNWMWVEPKHLQLSRRTKRHRTKP
jgi:hypothetical protein